MTPDEKNAVLIVAGASLKAGPYRLLHRLLYVHVPPGGCEATLAGAELAKGCCSLRSAWSHVRALEAACFLTRANDGCHWIGGQPIQSKNTYRVLTVAERHQALQERDADAADLAAQLASEVEIATVHVCRICTQALPAESNTCDCTNTNARETERRENQDGEQESDRSGRGEQPGPATVERFHREGLGRHPCRRGRRRNWPGETSQGELLARSCPALSPQDCDALHGTDGLSPDHRRRAGNIGAATPALLRKLEAAAFRPAAQPGGAASLVAIARRRELRLAEQWARRRP